MWGLNRKKEALLVPQASIEIRRMAERAVQVVLCQQNSYRFRPEAVIPAKAGIQFIFSHLHTLDPPLRDCVTIVGLLIDSHSKAEIWCQSEPVFPAKLAPEVFNPGAGNQGLLSTFLTVPDCFPHYDTASCAGVTTCEKHVDNAVA